MALAPAEAGPGAVDCDQWDEDQVGLDDRCFALGLQYSERPRLERVAGAEAERLGGIVERRESDDPPDRTRFLDRSLRTDLRAQRGIAANDFCGCA